MEYSKINCVLLSILLAALVQSKYIDRNFDISSLEDKKNIFIGKFEAPKDSIVKIWFRVIHQTPLGPSPEDKQINLAVGIFTHSSQVKTMEDWHTPCHQKFEKSDFRMSTPINFNNEGYQYFGADLTDLFSPTSPDSKMVYLYTFDCEGQMLNIRPKDWTLRVQLKSETKDGTAFSRVEDSLYWYKLACFLLAASSALFYLPHFVRNSQKDAHDTNHPLNLAFVSLVLKTASLITDLGISQLEHVEGDSFPLLDFFSKSVEVAGGYFLLCLLLYLSQGWTVRFASVDEMELFLPLTVALGVFKLMVLGIERVVKSEAQHLHVMDGIVGGCVCLMDLGFLGFFLHSIKTDWAGLAKGNDGKRFYTHVVVAGMVYMLNHFVMYVICLAVDPLYRLMFIDLGCSFVACGCNLYVLWIVGDICGGVYSKISNLNYVLPSKRLE